MQYKDELIRRANIGRRIAELLAVPSVQDAYTQSMQSWADQLCACDPHDTTAMVTLKGMRSGLEAFWMALAGLVELGADAERQMSGEATEAAGRMIA